MTRSVTLKLRNDNVPSNDYISLITRLMVLIGSNESAIYSSKPIMGDEVQEIEKVKTFSTRDKDIELPNILYICKGKIRLSKKVRGMYKCPAAPNPKGYWTFQNQALRMTRQFPRFPCVLSSS